MKFFFELVIVWVCHWYRSFSLMFTISFHQKIHLFFPFMSKDFFFQNFLSRFLCSKKLENMNLPHFGPGSRPISDNFFFVWKVFLIDFLSKMKSQKGSLGFRMILKWWFLVYSEEIFENNSRVLHLPIFSWKIFRVWFYLVSR